MNKTTAFDCLRIFENEFISRVVWAPERAPENAMNQGFIEYTVDKVVGKNFPKIEEEE